MWDIVVITHNKMTATGQNLIFSAIPAPRKKVVYISTRKKYISTNKKE